MESGMDDVVGSDVWTPLLLVGRSFVAVMKLNSFLKWSSGSGPFPPTHLSTQPAGVPSSLQWSTLLRES